MKIYPHVFEFDELYNLICKYCGKKSEIYHYNIDLKYEIIYKEESCISDEDKIIKDIIE